MQPAGSDMRRTGKRRVLDEDGCMHVAEAHMWLKRRGLLNWGLMPQLSPSVAVCLQPPPSRSGGFWRAGGLATLLSPNSPGLLAHTCLMKTCICVQLLIPELVAIGGQSDGKSRCSCGAATLLVSINWRRLTCAYSVALCLQPARGFHRLQVQPQRGRAALSGLLVALPLPYPRSEL